jgi:hypothetical protein
MPNSTVMMPVYEQEQGYVDTWGVGGDRFGFLPSSMFHPDPFIGTTTLVPEALLSIPPTYSQLGPGGALNTQYGNGQAASQASAAPWSPSVSPLPWTIAALIVAVFGVHWLYFRDKRKGKK